MPPTPGTSSTVLVNVVPPTPGATWYNLNYIGTFDACTLNIARYNLNVGGTPGLLQSLVSYAACFNLVNINWHKWSGTI